MILALSTPVLYALELTPACNNRCLGCCNVFAAQRSRAPMDLDAWRSVLDRIQPYAHLVKLTGGEPTLHPRFDGITAHLDQQGIPFSLFTNGCWTAPEHLIATLKANAQFRGFLISLHGASPAVHEAFSGVPGSFYRTVGNIQRATEADLPVTISAVLYRRNLDRLGEILGIAQELGVAHVVFNRYIGPRNPEVEPTDKELRQAVIQIEAWHQEGAQVKFGNCFPQCFVPSSSTGCLAGVAYCTIDPWGNMRPCNHSPIRCGNLLEKPVQEIWRSAEMDRWREMIPPECHACAEFSRCHGGCRAAAADRNLAKDPLAGDPLLEAQMPPQERTLYEGLRPVGVYQLREEPFGYVLMRGNRIVPVPHDARAILDLCDGKTTLRQIEVQFGTMGLDLVAGLWERGLLLLEDS